jgi:hypothetical protein
MATTKKAKNGEMKSTPESPKGEAVLSNCDMFDLNGRRYQTAGRVSGGRVGVNVFEKDGVSYVKSYTICVSDSLLRDHIALAAYCDKSRDDNCYSD